jgi:cellobiose epimerase
MHKDLLVLRDEMVNELSQNILSFWLNTVDEKRGGFYGRIDGAGVLHPEAEKGAVLNARMLWTFSAAYRVLGKPEYLDAATRAMDYILDKFWDKENGGVYWTVDCNGNPKDTKKQIYAQGFVIYGLSEYARATGNQRALDKAKELFYIIEKYAFDKELNGYFEAFTADWHEIEDMRLSEKDANEKKTMNTHLHILEPYANLYRVWKDEQLELQLRNLISIFTTKITNSETAHFDLFFDEHWNKKGNFVSYGHDIEGSWLIHEAALVLGDGALVESISPLVKRIAEASTEGLQPDGSMIYESNLDANHTDTDRHWWVQAETVVGFFNLFEHFGSELGLQRSVGCWEFIKKNLIADGGEWYWSVAADGSKNTTDDRAGLWKCPYHNGRMCLELAERIAHLDICHR